jgi:23S rRNA pseudouridine1911/1915/1917 synthase
VEILWEDDWYIAVAKPPHIPTHPARRHQLDTLASRMAHLKQGENFIFRALTRLDLDTSGAVILAKNQLAANEFSKLLIQRRVNKEYTAVCLGKIPCSAGIINEPIYRPDPSSILRATGMGDEAITEFTLLKTSESASLVSVSPITGRTHQIRVHFKHLGYPVLADTLYSCASPLIDRQALHASKISFVHPFTKEHTSIFCPLFSDMEHCIKELFGD